MKYRKKPVVIDAFRWTADRDQTEDPEWIVEALRNGDAFFETPVGESVVLKIRTLEGIMTAQPGDYIIRGVKGEIYPCKPDIFEATYEREDWPPSQTVRPDWKAIQWTGDKDMMNHFCDDLVEQGRLGYDAHNNVIIRHSHETVEIVALGNWIVRTEDGRFFSATGSALSGLAEMEGREKIPSA